MPNNMIKKYLSWPACLGIVFILFFPHRSWADAITPIFNLFTPDTIVFASILTGLIILVEALLLWRWTKPISFRLSLWRATIINIISSAAGSIVAWLFFQEQMIWGMMGLYIPMFLLTLATETPALKYLYRHNGFGWMRSIKVSLGLNLISYLVVFIAQYGLFFAYLGYADFADNQTIQKWTDLSLLEGETGYIYTVKYVSADNFGKYVFNRYDVTNKKWEIVDPGFERGIDPSVWDVRANLIACRIDTVDLTKQPITILNAAAFSKLSTIDGDFKEVRISPDLDKLAVLEYNGEIKAPRDDESAFILGLGCKLKIYAIASGLLQYESPMLALDEGLSWTSNSTIVFSSLRDQSLFQDRGVETHGRTYGRSYAEAGQFPVDLYLYDLTTHSIGRLVEGQWPLFIQASNEMAFIRERGSSNRDLWQINVGGKKPHLIFRDIRRHETAVSPSGRKYLILVPHKQPFGSRYFLTLIDPIEPVRKLILEPDANSGFRWVNKK